MKHIDEIARKLLELNRAGRELLFEQGFLLPDAQADALLDSLDRTRELLLQLTEASSGQEKDAGEIS